MKRTRLVVLFVAVGVLVAAFLAARSSIEDQDLVISTVPRVVAADSEFAECLDCHDNPDASLDAGRVSLVDFTHEKHFLDSGNVGCGNCHGLDTHVRTPLAKPAMDDCFVCHVKDGPASELPCLRCHDNTTVSPPQSHFVADWEGAHGTGAVVSLPFCETCHSRQTFCNACHGTEIPHPEEWATYVHAAATFEAGVESCARCHDRGPELRTRDECDSCHHPHNMAVPVWRDAHPEVVKSQGGATCFECHDPDTCARCHTTGEEDFSADLNRLSVPPDGEEPGDEGGGDG